MSATEIKEVVYHCPCRRFVQGTPVTPCTCLECGREHVPTDEWDSETDSVSVHNPQLLIPGT